MKISVSPSVVFMSLIIVLSGRASSAAIPLLAALIHEAGHLLYAFFFSVPIKRVRLSLFGALIETPPLACSYKNEAFLALSGPAANILSASMVIAFSAKPFSYGIMFFIASSFAFAFINILPIEGFDGGRCLSCLLLSKFSPAEVRSVMEWLSLLFIFLLWSASVYFIIKTGSYLSLYVFSGALFARIFLHSDEKAEF